MELNDFFTVLIGAIISWVISHCYYAKANRNIATERDILPKELRSKNTIEHFEKELSESHWSKRTIENQDIWVSDGDNSFQTIGSTNFLNRGLNDFRIQ